MDTLRRRVPFKANDDDDDVEHILDEQEQEEIVEELRKATEASNAQYQLLIAGLLSISISAQLLFLFTPSKHTPIANIVPIPPSSGDPSPIPLSTILTLVSILAQANVSLHSQYPRAFLSRFVDAPLPKPLPFDLVYALSAVGPALSLFLGKPWQTTVWWCLSPFVIFVVQTVVQAVEEGNHGVAELEGMRYTAPGA